MITGILLFTLQVWTAPVRLNAEVVNGYLELPITIDGKPAKAAISTSATTSIITSDFATPHTVSLGNIQLPTKLEVRENDPVLKQLSADVLLGADALANLSVGFELDSNRLTFWKGSLSKTELANWFNSKTPWPMHKSVEYDSINATDSNSPALVVNANLNGVTIPVVVASDLYGTAIDSKLLQSQDLDNGQSLVKGLKVGQRDIPYIPIASSAPYEPTIGTQQIRSRITISALLSRYVIMDFPARSIYSEHLSDSAKKARLISSAAGVSVYFSGWNVLLGPLDRNSKFGSQYAKYEDQPLSYIGHQSAEEIIAAANSKDLGPLLTDLLKDRAEGMTINLKSPFQPPIKIKD